jgi:hypothetical protein
MTKQLTDAEIEARLFKAERELAAEKDPKKIRSRRARVERYKGFLTMGMEGRTKARVKANEKIFGDKHSPRRFR